jgi:cobalt-zinc-cadmium efflux system membrane fusion protein
MTETDKPARRNKRILLTILGGLGLIGVTAAATVAIEHRLHEEDAGHEAHGHDEHGHDEHGEGEQGHDDGGDEHGKEGHAEGKDKVKLTPAMLANAKIGIRTAAPGKVSVTLSLPGEVALNTERVAHVSPRVGGSVREVKRQLGDSVKKGDVLAILDSRELAEMQRDLAAAKERLDLAESNFKRQEQLWLEKISAEKDFLAAKQALAEAKIEFRAASQKLAAGAGARASGGGLVLTAPLDGTIIEKHAVVGEVLSDQKLAFVIADLSTLWVNVTVYSKDLPRVHVGQRAIVRAEGIGEPAAGQVTYIDRVVGEQTRSATARVVLDNPSSKWRPGLFATADIALEDVDAAIVIAHDAVQRVESKNVVFVQDGDVFVPHPVVVGRQGFNEKREIVVEVQGVSPGEKYAAENSFILKAELGKSEAGHEH